MKKSVIIVIGIIYIASIVFIGFFGMKITAFDEIYYVKKVECTNFEITKVASDGAKVIQFIFDPAKSQEENVFQLQWKVLPEDASNRNVEFVYDKESKVGSVDMFGRVFIEGKGSITIDIVSTDGSNIKEKVRIVSKSI